MTGLDWLILAVIVLSVVLAAAQGFFYEVFSLGGAILGFLLAAWEYAVVAPWFAPHVKSQSVANAAGFMVIFVSVIILAGIAGRVTRWALKEVGLRWVDRILGAAFGLVRGALMVSVGLLALTAFMPESKVLEGSKLSDYFLVTGKVAIWVTPGDLQQKFQDGLTILRKHRMELLSPAHSQAGATEGKTDKSAPGPQPARR